MTSTARTHFILFVAWLILAAARIGGPSDLYDKEQPRTIAYTADILVNGHVFLPYDTFGIPATKPPLYNWMSVPFVQVFGYREWALKIPSLLASLVIVLTIHLAARRLVTFAGAPAQGLQSLGLVAPLIYLATPMTAKLMYVARPDMLLTAFLFAAWLAATIMIQSPQANRKAQALFWICTVGAALTKGPSALLALAYLVLGAKLLSGKWSTLKRTGWWWGVPLLLAVVGATTWIANRQEPEFFRQVLMGREVAGRIAKPLQILMTLPNGPFYVLTRFLPWSPLAVVILFFIPMRKWFAHPLGPAILWLLIILIAFSFMSTKRPDRYAPVFPAVALMAAYCVLQIPVRFRMTPRVITAAGFLMIVGLCVHNQFFSDAAITHFGDNAIAFALEVRAKTQGAPILFLDGELTPVETLLAENQSPELTAQSLATFRWAVRYDDPGAVEAPVLISRPLFDVSAGGPASLALYPLPPQQAAELYRTFQLTPRDYLDNATSNSTRGPGADRWSQYHHVHAAATTGASRIGAFTHP